MGESRFWPIIIQPLVYSRIAEFWVQNVKMCAGEGEEMKPNYFVCLV